MQVMATLCLATNRGTVTVGRRQHSLPLSPGYTPLPQRIRIRGSHWPFFPFLSSFSSVQSLSRVRLCAILRTAARQAFLSITNSRSLLKLLSRTCSSHTHHPHPHAREKSHTDPFLSPEAQKQMLSVFLLLRKVILPFTWNGFPASLATNHLFSKCDIFPVVLSINRSLLVTPPPRWHWCHWFAPSSQLPLLTTDTEKHLRRLLKLSLFPSTSCKQISVSAEGFYALNLQTSIIWQPYLPKVKSLKMKKRPVV